MLLLREVSSSAEEMYISMSMRLRPPSSVDLVLSSVSKTRKENEEISGSRDQ
jgi:hypothetical protein